MVDIKRSQTVFEKSFLGYHAKGLVDAQPIYEYDLITAEGIERKFPSHFGWTLYQFVNDAETLRIADLVNITSTGTSEEARAFYFIINNMGGNFNIIHKKQLSQFNEGLKNSFS